MSLLIRITYTYAATENSTKVTSCVRLTDPDDVIKAAMKARRKNDWIWITDHEQGIRHAFPAERLIDVVTEPHTEAAS